MIQRYLETRLRNVDSVGLISDVIRHFHARQHLGAALVVSTNAEADCQEAIRQWQKLTRALQNRRATTFAAEDILRLTSTITHMQRLQFAAARPQDHPGSQVYFVDGSDVGLLPANCMTAYIISMRSDVDPNGLVNSLPGNGLIVDYTGVIGEAYALCPKVDLEHRLSAVWRRAADFLTENDISVSSLSISVDQSMAVCDGVLDAILAQAVDFSVIANDFLEALSLARPLRSATKRTRDQYEDLVRLISRVDALTPGAVDSRGLDVDFDDSFALREETDMAETLADDIAAQFKFGRFNIACSMMSSELTRW